MAREDFGGQTGGGGIVDFDFEVTDAYFGISEKFKEKTGLDTIFLHLLGKTDLEDWPVLDADTFHPSYNLGSDWEVVDGGKAVEYVGSGKRRLGKWMGRFSEKALDLTADVANTPDDPLAGDAEPWLASTWVGTRWHMDEVEYDFGNMGKSAHLMPTAYLGKATGSPAASGSAPSAAAAAPSNGGGSGLRDVVAALARSAEDYKSFQSAALNIPNVASEEGLISEILDQSEKGIFASARA